MTSLILLSGMLGFGFSPAAFADHNATGEQRAEGCGQSDPRSSAAARNPHCASGSETIETSPCNGDSDGDITPEELLAAGVVGNITDAQNAIIAAEGGTGNGIIDTQAEYDALKGTFPQC